MAPKLKGCARPGRHAYANVVGAHVEQGIKLGTIVDIDARADRRARLQATFLFYQGLGSLRP